MFHPTLNNYYHLWTFIKKVGVNWRDNRNMKSISMKKEEIKDRKVISVRQQRDLQPDIVIWTQRNKQKLQKKENYQFFAISLKFGYNQLHYNKAHTSDAVALNMRGRIKQQKVTYHSLVVGRRDSQTVRRNANVTDVNVRDIVASVRYYVKNILDSKENFPEDRKNGCECKDFCYVSPDFCCIGYSCGRHEENHFE